MKLYKYTTAERGLQILENSSVVLSHPQDFNDPFDSFPRWDEKEFDKACDIIVDYGIEIVLVQAFEQLAQKLGKFKGRMLVNFVLGEYYLMKKLVKKRPSEYVAVVKIENINKLFAFCDKFGKNSPKQQEAKTQFDEQILAQRKILQDKISDIKNIREKLLIGCFSSSKDSMLMWSHYADSHKGVCIEFDIPEEDEKLFQKVIYSEERPTNNFVQAVRKMCGQHLANGNFDKSDEALNKLLLEPYITKLIEWAYEDEYRLLLSDNDIKMNENLKLINCTGGEKRIAYKMPTIKTIYSGAKFSQEKSIDFINACVVKGVKFNQIKISQDKYSLN